MSALYLLDTNTVAYSMSGRSRAVRHTMDEVVRAGAKVSISALTAGELFYGVAKQPSHTRLRIAVEEFCADVPSLPWNAACARAYGPLRARLAAAGNTLSPIDLLLAAHAVALGATLVTHDKAFTRLGVLERVADWATDV